MNCTKCEATEHVKETEKKIRLQFENELKWIAPRYKDALESIRFGIACLEAVDKGNKIDLKYAKNKMREVLFNESSPEYRPINYEV